MTKLEAGSSNALSAGLASAEDGDERVSPSHWFQEAEFYLTGAVYMFTRLLSNLSLTYLPFFVLDALRLPETALATAPAALYLASFAATFCQPFFARHLSRATVCGVAWIRMHAALSIPAALAAAQPTFAPQ